MLIYVILALLNYYLLMLSKKTKDKKKKTILISISFLTVFLVSALRVNVGTDYQSYVNWFNEIDQFSFHYTNFLFNNMIFIIKLITNNPQCLFVITSFIILILIYTYAIEEFEDYDMALFLFIVLGFYFSTFNGIRQWLAIAVFMFSFKYIKQKELIKYLGCIIVASLFHITSLLLIPAYFLFKLNIKDRYKMIIIGASFIIFKLVNFNGLIAFICKKVAFSFYVRYFASGVDLTQSVGSFLPIILSFGMFMYYILFKKNIIEKITFEKYERNKTLCFYIVIFAITNTVNNLFSRFSYYFIPFIIFLLPDFFVIFNGKYNKIMKLLVVVFGVVFMVINTLLKNSNNPLPYLSIFS